MDLLVLLVVLVLMSSSVLFLFFNHCTKQNWNNNALLYVNNIWIFVLFFKKSTQTQKKSLNTCACYYKTNSTERIEDGKISWLKSKRRRRPPKTAIRAQEFRYFIQKRPGRSLFQTRTSYHTKMKIKNSILTAFFLIKVFGLRFLVPTTGY